MPVSDGENKSVVARWYREIHPDIVVDIGPGEGTYAKLLEEEVMPYPDWYAVEAWAPYVNQFNLHDLYKDIIVADVRYVELERVVEQPDLVIIGDVLEHLTKSEAIETLNRLRDWCRNVIVSIPLLHLDQGPYEGNYFETHRDHWHHEEMTALLGKGLRDTKRGDVLGYYWWNLPTTSGEQR